MPKLKPTTGYVDIGELFVCNCGIPIARRTGAHHYDLIRFHDGRKTSVNLEISNGRIGCEVCGRGFAYITVTENIPMTDWVNIQITPAPAL